MYCFHDKIRIYFMSFIVQISPFVHLFTLKIVFRWGALPPWTAHQGSALYLLGALSGSQTPRCKLCLHFILYLAMPLVKMYIVIDEQDSRTYLHRKVKCTNKYMSYQWPLDLYLIVEMLQLYSLNFLNCLPFSPPIICNISVYNTCIQ